jgi:hypothetical protein
MGAGELLRWLAVLAVAGAVTLGVLHGPALVDWGKGLFADKPHPVGATVHVAGSTYHPALDVRVDRVDMVDTRATVGLKPGQRAVAVRLRITDPGSSPWRLGSGTSVRLRDQLGVVHRSAPDLRTAGLTRLPTATTVRAGASVEGYVVFALPRNRTPWQVEVRLAPEGEGALVWALPR